MFLRRLPTACCLLILLLLLAGCTSQAPQFLPLPNTLPIVEPIADPLGAVPAATPETASPAEQSRGTGEQANRREDAGSAEACGCRDGKCPLPPRVANPLGAVPAEQSRRTTEQENRRAGDGFAAWMEAHKTTCAQCRRSMDESPDEPICLEAFRKLQAICGTVLEKPAETETPANGGCKDGQCGPRLFRTKPVWRWGR